MGIKISDLPNASNSNNNDLLAIVQNGETKNIEKATLVNSVNKNIANEYSIVSTYSIGDYCIYEGQLYICLNNIDTPEEWTANHWQLTTLGEASNNKLGEKVNQTQIVDSYSESTQNGYCCNYVNGLNTYSTNEVRVGTWIDGKPLYRKVFSDNMPTVATGLTNIPLNIQNIGMRIIEFAGVYRNDSWNPNPNVGSDGLVFLIDIAGSNIRLMNANDSIAGHPAFVSVLYTKTSD